ncbi:hypothetical protein HDU76_001060 [Blyttiomyces sp. JEL0837]|nr:hypothetical protein HDU76_001060 [Blyttiomyces sp. JEL0837]
MKRRRENIYDLGKVRQDLAEGITDGAFECNSIDELSKIEVMENQKWKHAFGTNFLEKQSLNRLASEVFDERETRKLKFKVRKILRKKRQKKRLSETQIAVKPVRDFNAKSLEHYFNGKDIDEMKTFAARQCRKAKLEVDTLANDHGLLSKVYRKILILLKLRDGTRVSKTAETSKQIQTNKKHSEKRDRRTAIIDRKLNAFICIR